LPLDYSESSSILLRDGVACTFRRASKDDISRLIEIDESASGLFEPTGLLSADSLADHVPAEALAQAVSKGWLIAAYTEEELAIGFVMATEKGEALYIDQISVDPAMGRSGIGRALMRYIEQEAVSAGFRELTLSTFRDVAWNAPFYASLGYKHIKRADFLPYMLEIEAAQAAHMDVSKRTFMRKRLRKRLFRARTGA